MESDGFLKARIIDIDAGKPVVLIHEKDAERMSIHLADRVEICSENASKTCGIETGIVDLTDTYVRKGEVGIFNDLAKSLKLSKGERVKVVPGAKPDSIGYIKKKLDGEELNAFEIEVIVKDIVDDKLSDIELSSFITASYICGYSMKETVAFTESMVNTGDRLEFEGVAVDKHCIGGVPGNRTTMVVVPTMAALNVKMPKTSSRAITSPAGTADTMEVLCNVNFSAADVKRLVEQQNACLVWGGALNLAPADDKIIRVEYPLSIDAEGQVLASIVSKKKSVGSNYVLIDVPCGPGAKIEDETEAHRLGEKFVALGKEVDMGVKYILSDGSHPIGHGIGPALEARDVLQTLQGDGSKELREKSIMMAGILLEFSGEAQKGKGRKAAKDTIESGMAFEKMKDIIKAQGGNPNIKPEEIKIGSFRKEFFAEHSGKVVGIDNKATALAARAAGCPKDSRAGILLDKVIGDKVGSGEKLFTVYAQSKVRLGFALDSIKKQWLYDIK
jgi:AMP phosphorylase